MHSLCIAEQLGVLESIKHIAKEIHERDMAPPPPPPYVSYPRPRQHTVKTSSLPENTNREVICSRNLCSPWDGNESLRSEGNTNVQDDTFIHGEVSKEESLKDSASITKVRCRSDNEESLDTEPSSLLNECSITTDLYVEAMDVAVSSSSLGGEGLRRRRKEKPDESSLSKARDSKSKKKAVSRTETVANNSDSRKFICYGIGAGTFLY